MKMQKSFYKETALMLYEIGSLRKIPRAHRQSLLLNDISDNLSSHIFRTTWVGWILSKLTGADTYKIILMCLIHDLSETRSGDQNWVHKKYVKVFEDEIINDQFKNKIGSKELIDIHKEYEERKTLEAKLAKDADLIDQILLLKEHSRAGNKEAESWLKTKSYSKNNQQYLLLSHPKSKALAKEIIRQCPSDWWKDIWTHKRR